MEKDTALTILQNEIIKIADDSFDEGAKALLHSLILGLEKALELHPNITGKEMLEVVKYWNEKKYLS